MPSKLMINEEAISWKVDGIEVNATLTRPDGRGPHPAVIFVAGSGPTDRNWNTPMIPGTNGSGALLAHELTQSGFITLRYDKRASGPHMPDNMKLLAGKISMQGHTAELAGGMSRLMNVEDVDPAKIFILTNSEGCVHALNYQTQGKNPPVAGMVLTSAFARATGELARSQIASQLGAVPGGEAMLAAYDSAMKEFMASRPVPVDENLPEGLRQVIQAITQPVNQPFGRELWIFNPIEKLTGVTVPVLIIIGKKDIQVDWQTDGALFEAVAAEHRNITVTYAENANHVLKLEPKPRAELTPAEVTVSYGSDEVMLDPEAVEVIIYWLHAQL
jgi:uncharacterized protein